MSSSSPSSGGERRSPGPVPFGQTQWSVVLAAAGKNDVALAEKSMEKLCRTYWRPLYTFIRCQGETQHDAQDLTQEFFGRLLEKDFLSSVDPSKGRFRSFLLASLKHFLNHQRERGRAQKRGGGIAPLPLDDDDPETRIRFQPADPHSPDKEFEKRWALTLLEQSLARLRHEYSDRGKVDLFEQLKTTLTEGRGVVAYAKLAENLGMSEASVKMSVHRLRQRYRELLRAEIAETVAHESEVEDELKEVFRALSQ